MRARATGTGAAHRRRHDGVRWAGVAAAVLAVVVVAGGIVVGTMATVGAAPSRPAAENTGQRIADEAASQSGVPYCDGGGTIHGPSYGGVDEAGCPPNTAGFDCMSLVQFAVYQVTGIALPGDGTQPRGVGTSIAPKATIAEDQAELLPGDAVFWGGTGIDAFAHSGIYAGNGEVWDAIGTQQPVQEHTMTYLLTIYTYDGAMRYWTPPPPTTTTTTTTTMSPAPVTVTSGHLAAPVVGMAAVPGGTGYWLADAQGGVSAHGSAVGYGSLSGHPLNAPIAHIVATPDGRGYWLVAADGGTFTFGDARFYGSMGGQHLNAPVVDLAPTPDGHGYWLVASDGGIFAFGDARFHGSMGGRHLNAPMVGMAADPVTGGYWEVATDGGIFAFGAPFDGSTGGLRLNRPINGMAATADGGGYWFVASDGGIFAEGDAAFDGSTGGTPLDAPVVGMAADRATGGYWLVAADGGVFSFHATFYGSD